MKKTDAKPAPSATFHVYAGGKLIEVKRVKAYHGPAPKRAGSAKLPRNRRKSA